jgi:hypothetical protein
MPEDEKMSEDPRKLRAWIKLAERIIKTNKLENKKLHGHIRGPIHGKPAYCRSRIKCIFEIYSTVHLNVTGILST